MYFKTLLKWPILAIWLFVFLFIAGYSGEVTAQNFYYGNSFIDVCKHNATHDNVTILDSLRLRNNPSEQLQTTINYSTNTAYTSLNCGVIYNSIYWAAFNEGGILDSIPVGLKFNVLIPTANGSVILQLADISNISGNSTRINNVLLNNNPNALLFVTHNYNPSSSDQYLNNNNAPIGVKYDGTYWNIINEDGSPFPSNTVYNVFVADTSSHTFIQTATNLNTNGYSTFINNTSINDSNAAFIVTQNFNPGNSAGVYNPNPIGVKYTGNGWDIFNLNSNTMPLGASFNVIKTDDSIVVYTSGINTINSKQPQFNVFPNPAQVEADIDYNLNSSDRVTFHLLNSTGTIIKEILCGNKTAGQQQFKDDVSQLPNGLYVYEMITTTGVAYKKIIIIH